MVVSTLPTAPEGKGKGKAKEILIDAASLQALRDGEKNVQMNVVVHPALNAAFISKLAADEANVVNDGGKQTLRRTAYSQALRRALAAATDYTGDLVIPGRQGGNVIGIATAFNTVVGSMFNMARSMGAVSNMPEEQIKAFAFDQARQNVAAHAQLKTIELTDEMLEKLWAGAELEEPEDEDEDEDEATV